MSTTLASKRFLFYILPPWIWGAAIFIGTSIPAEYLPEFVLFGPDKLIHMGIFLVFAVLVFRALSIKEKPLSRWQMVGWTILIAGSYAAFDELHQYFIPGRAPDFFDILADGAGIIAGVLLAVFNIKFLGLKPPQIESRSEDPPFS